MTWFSAILLFLGVVFIFLYLIRFDMPGKSWESYARQRNFSYQYKYGGMLTNSPWIKGESGGFKFKLDIKKRMKSQYHLSYFTRFVFNVHFRTDFSMVVIDDDIFTKTARRVGLVEDVKTGNSNFDSRFRVKTSIPEKCREILSDDIQFELLGADDLELSCEEDRLSLLTPGVIQDPVTLDNFLRIGGKFCGCLQTIAAPPSSAPPPPPT